MDKHIRAAQRFYRQVKEQQGIKVLQIGEDELQALLKDKERLDFIEKNSVSIISFKTRFLAARDNIGLFTERETLRETIDDAINELE